MYLMKTRSRFKYNVGIKTLLGTVDP